MWYNNKGYKGEKGIYYKMKFKNRLILTILISIMLVKPVFSNIDMYKEIFDANYYGVKYPEIASIYNNDPQLLYNHFVLYGMKEGRSPSSEFVLEYYKYNNKDLVEAFKDDNEKYYAHYVNKGKKEGRVADRRVSENEVIATGSAIVSNIPTPITQEETNRIANDYLILINNQNPIPVDYKPPLQMVTGGQYMHKTVAPIIEQILNDAATDGITLRVLSGYRSAERQEFLFNRRVLTYIASGQDPAYAFNLASMTNPLPGTSEHQSGLCMDIVESPYTSLVYDLENTDGYKWMLKHCAEYGFILRYPKDKSEITSIIYEPWHFRYVGIEAATQIMKNNLTLEEYILTLNKNYKKE